MYENLLRFSSNWFHCVTTHPNDILCFSCNLKKKKRSVAFKAKRLKILFWRGNEEKKESKTIIYIFFFFTTHHSKKRSQSHPIASILFCHINPSTSSFITSINLPLFLLLGNSIFNILCTIYPLCLLLTCSNQTCVSILSPSCSTWAVPLIFLILFILVSLSINLSIFNSTTSAQLPS